MTELAATAAIPIRPGPGGGAFYDVAFRPGAGLGLGEPDDSWSVADLVADLRFHRSLAALGRYARPRPMVVVAGQTDRVRAHWDRIADRSFRPGADGRTRRAYRR